MSKLSVIAFSYLDDMQCRICNTYLDFSPFKIAAGVRCTTCNAALLECDLAKYYLGETLQSMVLYEGAFTNELALNVVQQLFGIMEHAHARQRIHCHLNPKRVHWDGFNCFVTTTREPSGSGEYFSLDADFSHEGFEMLDYCAPECLYSDKWKDCRTDVYSLGALVYFLLSGKHPFNQNKVAVDLVLQKRKGPVPDLTVELGKSAADLSHVLQKAMAPKLKARFRSVQEFGEVLTAALSPPVVP